MITVGPPGLNLLQNKDQVFSIIQTFLLMIQNQFQAKVKVVRSDNGIEVFNTTCSKLFFDHVILHQRSVVRTPQQNGVVERKHRHLLDTTRAMRFQAHLPKKFWGECVLSATHVINMLPVEKLSWKSPFEVLYGHPPDYEHLKTVGCLCFSAIFGDHDKFAPRARKCIFLGYPSGKRYKLFDLETNKILVSRDVIFHENIFPFHKDTSEQGVLPLPVPLVNAPSAPSHSSPISISTTPSHSPIAHSPTIYFLFKHLYFTYFTFRNSFFTYS